MQDVPYLAQALSHVIENIRKERHISKTALADFSRLERRYLREIETGTKRPTVNA
ncbi:helix-turn-helix transcriptional regulator, partial [Desulfovibrio sp.]|uniref:helix-turn-helix domain-containing protein n=1 Tax=Desulfovibrio sp. TaxID=885 RepID=UPI0023D31772